MKRTISGQIGKGDIYHNNRKFAAEKAKCSRLTEFIESLGLMQKFTDWLMSKTQKNRSKNTQIQ